VPEYVPTDDVVDFTNQDPLVRALVTNGRMSDGAWRDADTYVWSISHWGMPGYMGIGDPARAADILAWLAKSQAGEKARVSLPPGWLDHAGSMLRVTPLTDWDWFFTTSAPALRPHEERARWLTESDEADIWAVLDDAMAGASAKPGDERVRRWAGLRDESGSLVACLADTSHSARIGHLASVVTATRHQGVGYGAALTSWVTRQMLQADADMVTLGMYADNHGARRFYERLGFTCEHRFSAAQIETDQGG
jgi:GNAT superfamily N-acetyltransferase